LLFDDYFVADKLYPLKQKLLFLLGDSRFYEKASDFFQNTQRLQQDFLEF
jgi:hypothetical protein